MPNGGIPPWIQSADPARYEAQGLEIGARMAAEQAAQQFREQQAMRQAQLDAQEQARLQAEFGLRAAEAARKSQAMLGYQHDISSGVDQMHALLKWGPQMGGQATATAAALRGLTPKPEKPVPTWAPAQLPQGMMGMLSSQGELKVLPRPAQTKVPAAGALTQVDRDELRDLEREQDKLMALHEKDTIGAMSVTKTDKEQNAMGKAAAKKYKERQAKIDDLEKQIKGIRAKSRGQTSGASAKVQRAREISAQHPDWSKAQVITAVNQEFASGAAATEDTGDAGD